MFLGFPGKQDRYDLSGQRRAFLMCVKKNRSGANRDIALMKEWLGQCQFEDTLCIDPDKMVTGLKQNVDL